MADPDSSSEPAGQRFAVLWCGAGVLVAGATGALVLSDDPRMLRLGLVAALWSTLLGAFAATRQRQRAGEWRLRVSEQQQGYEAELEREVAARREFELDVQNQVRRRSAEETSSEVQALRGEVHTLRQTLEQVFARQQGAVAEPAVSAGAAPVRSVPGGAVQSQAQPVQAVRSAQGAQPVQAQPLRAAQPVEAAEPLQSAQTAQPVQTAQPGPVAEPVQGSRGFPAGEGAQANQPLPHAPPQPVFQPALGSPALGSPAPGSPAPGSAAPLSAASGSAAPAQPQSWTGEPRTRSERVRQQAVQAIGPASSYASFYDGSERQSGTFEPVADSEPGRRSGQTGAAGSGAGGPGTAGLGAAPGAHSQGTAVVDLLAAYGGSDNSAESGDARGRRRRRG